MKRWSQRVMQKPTLLSSEYDRSVVLGTALCAMLLLVGIVAGGNSTNFFSLTGLLIVVGGTIGATLIHCSLEDMRRAWAQLKVTMQGSSTLAIERIEFLVGLAHSVRKNGLLILDRESQRIRDPFLRLGLEITVDGQPSGEIRRILETEMRTTSERTARAVQVFETLGGYAPAMGLIGTLMGLVQMLGALSDPSTVGPAMSVALLTTLYGAILANIVFLPIAGKLRISGEETALVKAITIEALVSLGKEENPIVLEQRLQSFLPLAGNY